MIIRAAISILIGLVALTSHCQGSKILAFFPFPAKSHHNVFQAILLELGRRGHQVDYYSPFPMGSPHQNVTLYKTRDFSMDLFESLGEVKLTDELNYSAFERAKYYHWIYGIVVELICQIKIVNDLIRSENKKYDLILHEGFFYQEYVAILAHKFQALSVSLLSSGDFPHLNEFAGLPDNTAYMVSCHSEITGRLTFTERLHNTYSTLVDVMGRYYSLYSIQNAVDQCFRYPGSESRPSLFKLASDNALILTSSHHSVGFTYPRAPHYKEIGGVHIVPNKSLPKDLEIVVNNSKHGIIYFSLGSYFDTAAMLHSNHRVILYKVFTRMKETVLWKTSEEPRNDLPKNIKQSKWFPQQDVLAHKKMKLFITHGGLLSSFETVYNAVPVLAIPLFADQAKNAVRMVESGVGDMIKLEDITEELLYQKIRELIDNDKYKTNMIKRSEILKDRPMKPLDEAAYWIEYVLRHGRVLQPAGVHLSFVQLHLLDVYSAVLGTLAAIYFATRLLVTTIFRRCSTSVTLSKKTR